MNESTQIVFSPGRMYRRRELHEKFGGQRQGGISTPAKAPFIFLTWRVRNSPGCCPDFLSAAKAPGVATIWPSSKAGYLLSWFMGKTPFVRFVFAS
jgi:hypothetical protein